MSLGEKPAGAIPDRSLFYMLSFSVAVMGTVIMSMTPVTVTLALRIAEIDPLHKADGFAWAIGLGNLVQIICCPLAGQISDASTFRSGMRKPWIIAGTFGSVVCALAIANLTTVLGIVLAWGAMSLFLAMAMVPLFAVISDQFPAHQHGLVSGLSGSTPLLGILAGSWIVNALPLSGLNEFLVPTAVGALLVVQFVLLLKDSVREASGGSRVSLRAFAKSFHFRPSTNPSFAWYLLVVLLIYIGAVTMQDYMVYLLQDAIKVPSNEIARYTFLAFLLANGVGCFCSLAGGIVSDRIGRRKSFYALGAAILAIGLVIQGTSHSIPPFMLGTLTLGIGYGLINGLTWALAVESSGDLENAARDMGLVNVALFLPGLIAPFLAQATHAERGYAPMYVICAVLAMLSIPLMLKIRKVR